MTATIMSTAIEALLRQPAAQAVGWALLQFVWQGAAVGVLTALALAALRRGAADVRYVVASIGLALMLTLPVVTGAQKFQSLRAESAAAFVDRAHPAPRFAASRPADAAGSGDEPVVFPAQSRLSIAGDIIRAGSACLETFISLHIMRFGGSCFGRSVPARR